MAIPAEAEGSNWQRMMKLWGPAAAEAQSDGISPGPQWSRPGTAPVRKLRDQQDPAERVYQIAVFFRFTVDDEGDVITPELFIELLDELQGYVVSIDVAKELHSINGLHPLLYNVMYNEHAAVRAKAAEAVTTMLQNNPTAQQLVMETDGLPPLLYNFSTDPDETSMTKALCAISALIRNNKPGITAFRREIGYVALMDVFIYSWRDGVTLQREALNLIQYLLHENSSDWNIVTQLGFLPIIKDLTSSDEEEIRKAASYLIHHLEPQVFQVLQKWMEGNIAMAPPEDLGAAREQKQLLDSAVNPKAVFPLLEKGLLPGEETSPGPSGPRDTCASRPGPSRKRPCPDV